MNICFCLIKDVPQGFLSLSSDGNAIQEQARKSFVGKASRVSADHVVDKENELGLSLRLSDCGSNQRERKEEQKEEVTNLMAVRRDHQQKLSGITSHVAVPPNRKTRVSVRARCQAATVSLYFLSLISLIISFLQQLNSYPVKLKLIIRLIISTLNNS